MHFNNFLVIGCLIARHLAIRNAEVGGIHIIFCNAVVCIVNLAVLIDLYLLLLTQTTSASLKHLWVLQRTEVGALGIARPTSFILLLGDSETSDLLLRIWHDFRHPICT